MLRDRQVWSGSEDGVRKSETLFRAGCLSFKAIVGLLQFTKSVDPVLLALPVVRDHVGRGVLNEGFTRELTGNFFDFGFYLQDFAMQPFFLRRGVNDAFEGKVNEADVGRARGVTLGSGFTEGNGFRMEENRQDGMLACEPISRRVDLPRKTFVAGNAVSGTKVACF